MRTPVIAVSKRGWPHHVYTAHGAMYQLNASLDGTAKQARRANFALKHPMG